MAVARLDRIGSEDHRYFRLPETAGDLAAAVLGRTLPFTDADFRRLLDELAVHMRRVQDGAYYPTARDHPVLPLLGALERHYGDQPVPEALHGPLQMIATVLVDDGSPHGHRALRRVDVLLGDAKASDIVPRSSDPWTQALIAVHGGLDDKDRALADRILKTAQAGTAAKPPETFSKRADRLIGDAGAADVARVAAALLTAAAAVAGTRESGRMSSELGDRLRGIAWIAGAAGGEDAARALAAFALAGWRRVPGHGLLCQKAANAAAGALGTFPAGAVQLGRLRAEVKQPEAMRIIDATIEAAADLLGVSPVEFEERIVPNFGLDPHGRRAYTLGDCTAELVLAAGSRCTLIFVNRAGRTVKTAPAAVKNEHAAELAALKQTAKDITTSARAQKLRLERLLLDDRAWEHKTWQARYMHHGLVGVLARALIWTIDGRSVISHDGRLVAVDGTLVPAPADTATVRLWHPVDTPAEDVKAWRRFLEDRAITQPFKQAHREVYLLTAAEAQTHSYTNRFAAHILRQHQLAALARGRGWRYTSLGGWEKADQGAALELPQHDLVVEFSVEPPWDLRDLGDGLSFNHVLSDRVRFTRNGHAVPLTTIPARVLSETLRDVDLFVGVTSIGNDPTWNAHGERRYWDYWQKYALGDLTEQAKIRQDLLEHVIPKLVIRDVASVDGRFLRVRGKLRTYKIHLGSGNILMEPNDEYLCIVPGRNTDPPVFLPFQGDQVLAEILAKALLLANDDTITDPTITSQIAPH